MSNDKVIYETDGTYAIVYTYDVDGTLISFNYDNDVNDSYLGFEYFYVRNIQGDITKILEVTGMVVAEYYYDAWGNIININELLPYNIIDLNPYTYRGYRYDSDIGMYYCNSRYYNPEIGRWLSADNVNYLDLTSAVGLNLFAYCENNPVMMVDPNGTFVSTILGGIFGGLWGGISAAAQGKDFWAGVAYGAITGVLAGFTVDVGIAIVTTGVGGIIAGLGFSVVGGLAIGFIGDIVGQVILDGTHRVDINLKQAFLTGIIVGITNGFGFGISMAAGSIGKEIPKGLGLFKTMVKSLSLTHTPIASWVFQSMLGFSLPAFGIMSGLYNHKQSNSYNYNVAIVY